MPDMISRFINYLDVGIIPDMVSRFIASDVNEIAFNDAIQKQKLNYRCKEGTVEAGSFKCGNTPEEAKKNYEKQQKEKQGNNSTKKIISSTSTKKSPKSSSSKSRIASSEETISYLTKSNDKLLATIKNSKDQEEIKKLQRIVNGNNKSIEYFKNKIKTQGTAKANYDNIDYNSIIKNSEKYINSSKEVKSTIENYTDIEGCYLINNYLGGKIKETEPEAKDAKKEISKLDNVFKNVPDTIDNIITWRSPSKGEVTRLLSQIESKKLEDLVGQTIIRKSFTSTSRDEKIVNMFHGNPDIIFEIKIPKGSKAISVESASNEDFSNVKEVLLDRGQTWKIEKVSKQDNKYKIHFIVIENGVNT
jgi:hypothetical protein